MAETLRKPSKRELVRNMPKYRASIDSEDIKSPSNPSKTIQNRNANQRRCAQNAPRRPETAPRRPQNAPRRPQHAPRHPPKITFNIHQKIDPKNDVIMAVLASSWAFLGASWPPKTLPRSPQDASQNEVQLRSMLGVHLETPPGPIFLIKPQRKSKKNCR